MYCTIVSLLSMTDYCAMAMAMANIKYNRETKKKNKSREFR